MIKVDIPISQETIESLRAGDLIALSGIMVTARDAGHKYMIDLIENGVPDSDKEVYAALQSLLRDGVIYHCGPVVEKGEGGVWRFTAAGPTTSIREEKYQDRVIEHFGVRAVIGKGGMGARTLAACQKEKAVYLHAVGGAAAVAAHHVKEVLGVYKLEFGLPEAFWKIRVEDFPLMVTMDSHGESLHDQVEKSSGAVLSGLLE